MKKKKTKNRELPFTEPNVDKCNDGDSNPDLEHGKLEFYP